MNDGLVFPNVYFYLLLFQGCAVDTVTGTVPGLVNWFLPGPLLIKQINSTTVWGNKSHGEGITMKETLAQEIVKRYRKSDETFRKSYEGQAQKKKTHFAPVTLIYDCPLSPLPSQYGWEASQDYT